MPFIRQLDPTRFLVRGQSLQCGSPGCERTFSTHAPKYSHLVPGKSRCPKCGGPLEWRWHTVDIAAHDCNGECGCENFTMTQMRKLKAMPPAERKVTRVRCRHIAEARDYALDLTIRQHQRENGGSK